MNEDPGLVWRLEGLAVRDVQCWITGTPAGLIAVRMVHGNETMLDEMYPDIKTAIARADGLRRDLMRSGWTVSPA